MFNILLTFAQLGAATSRVAIITYSMPLWATLIARLALGERIDVMRGAGLLLGASGLAILIAPLLHGGLPSGILYALAAALTWATVRSIPNGPASPPSHWQLPHGNY